MLAQQKLTDLNSASSACAICNGIEGPMFTCELCSVSVHRSCYGSELLSLSLSQPWLCQRCQYCIENSYDPDHLSYFFECDLHNRCIYCPNKRGALKLIEKSYWAHVACVELIPEVCFESGSVEKEKVKELAKIPSWRYGKECNYCKKKTGVTLLCEYWNCKATFHSSCAVEGLEGLYEGNRECYENCAGIYCKDHATRIKRKEKGCKEPVRKILEGRKNIEEHKHYAVKKVDESLPIEEEEDRMTEKSQPEKCGNIEDAHELLFKVGKRLPTEQIIDLVKKYEKTHQGPYSVTIEFS